MNRLYAIFAAGSMLAGAAAAQESRVDIEKMAAAQLKIVGLQGGIMGKPVKGAPYSGVEVNETNQALADGTRIHNETQTQVYRDSEGRLRRETANEITIWDPVANASYVLNPKTQTARKLPMGNFLYSTTRTAPGEVYTYSLRVGGPGAEAGAGAEAKLRAEMESHMRLPPGAMVHETNHLVVRRWEKPATESLGKRVIEGVNSEGTRTVSTMETGAIGNDRPIQTVSERWFSPELQTAMLVRHTDPRTGEEVFKLINVSRAEPPAYLFQVPVGYQIVESKM